MKKMPILFPSLTCREERDDVLREVGMCVLRSTGGPVYIVVWSGGAGPVWFVYAFWVPITCLDGREADEAGRGGPRRSPVGGGP